ncbi:MAG: hypothetical protein HY553_04630 [Elusimicrobia bacterium]|nr:hypothetical protein [Elusimicrobiota bacterium]
MEPPAWREVRLGTRAGAEGWARALEERGLVVGRVAASVAGGLAYGEGPAVARLVRVRGAELGLGPQATVREFADAAPAFGLRPCRPEAALALRAEYLDQPRGEVLWFATAPILDPAGEPGYFSAGHDGRGRWLCFGCGGPDCSWGRWRRRTLSPAAQERLVPLFVCECSWSRRGDAPVSVVLER